MASGNVGISFDGSWPATLCEVAQRSDSIQDFGQLLREWEHTISRKGIDTPETLHGRMVEEPRKLRGRFPQGDVADAFLAALAEWLCVKHGQEPPEWTADPERVADQAWWANGVQVSLRGKSPSSFRTRNLFTIPHDPFRPRPNPPN